MEIISEWIREYKFRFIITKSRLTKLGDYTSPRNGKSHQITVNGNLNPYAFLITLVHEIAHLITWNKYKNKFLPHGKEWKEEFRILLGILTEMKIFPDDILENLRNYMKNPFASGCTDMNLVKALKKYDLNSDYIHLEDVTDNSIFIMKNGRKFIKGEKLRKRFKCQEIQSRKYFLVSPVAEVIQVSLF